MQITEINHKFTNLSKRTSTSRIIIHHSASLDVSAAEIHKWHLARGFSGIGYHYVIRQNGTIETGRPLDTIGAHAGSPANSDSIGICLTGNFETQVPMVSQINSLVELIKYLNNYYKKDLTIIGHKDVASTACPGKNFPWAELHQKISLPDWKLQIIQEALAQGLISQYHHPDELAPKWFVLAIALNLLKK